MATNLFSIAFLLMIAFTVALRVWLALRQVQHVRQRRDAVPLEFADQIALPEHQKGADYTVAKQHLGLFGLAVDTLLLFLFTWGGLLTAFDLAWRKIFPDANYSHSLALFASVALAGFLAGLPLSLYRTFSLEDRFGFNKMTLQLFLADKLRQLLLAVLLGCPLLLTVLWLMGSMGERWWLWVWTTWMGFNLLLLLLYPTCIAPLFNKFVPLPDGEMKVRIEALLDRCGFASSGLFVMDGSKRSAHGNAYFSGFGRAKRIVFFDTLIDKLSMGEVEAVLAHELGHFRHRHVWKRIAIQAVTSLAFLWLLSQLMHQPWFYAGLNVGTGGTVLPGTAMALILFSLVLPLFTFPFTPLLSWLSRRQEFEADAYASCHADGKNLIAALFKLYRDNAATLTPDPLHSLFYDSHPPASERIAQLKRC